MQKNKEKFLVACAVCIPIQQLYSDPLIILSAFVVSSVVALAPTAMSAPQTIKESFEKWWSKKNPEQPPQPSALNNNNINNITIAVGSVTNGPIEQSSTPVGPASAQPLFSPTNSSGEPSAGAIPALRENKRTGFLNTFNFSVPSYHETTEYVKSHKKDLLIKTVILCYLALNGALVYTSTQLHRADCWSCWRQELNLTALMEVKQHDLAQALYTAIGQRYNCSADSMTHNTLPMNLFLKSLEYEHTLLLRYRRLCTLVHSIVTAEQAFINYSGTFFRSCCNRVGLGWMPSIGSYMFSHATLRPLFFIDESLETSIDDRINRLTYLKTVLFTWMTNRQHVKLV